MQPCKRVYRLPVLTAMLMLGLLLQGCGGKDPVRPEARLDAVLNASGDVNSGPGQTPRPVSIRVYELKSAGAFSSADFFSLYDREGAALGADLLNREEVSLAPGEWQRVEKVLEPDAAYLGVVVAFRDIDRSQWRSVTRLRPDATNKVVVNVGADRLSVSSN